MKRIPEQQQRDGGLIVKRGTQTLGNPTFKQAAMKLLKLSEWRRLSS